MDSINPTPPQGAFGAAMAVKLYRLRTLIRRNWWIMLLTVSLGLALEGWIVFNKPDLFTSSSEMMVRDEVNLEEGRKINEAYDSIYGNTLKMLHSSTVLEGARRRLDLEAPELSGSVDINASVAPRTSIFTVSGTGTNPEYTRRFVDAVVGEFIQQYRSLRREDIGQTSQEIRIQLEKIERDLKEATAARDEFVKTNGMQAWTKQMDDATNYLSQLRTRQAELNLELQRLQILTPDQLLVQSPSSSQNFAQQGGQSANTSSNALFSTDLVQRFVENNEALMKLNARVAERSRVWKPKHPKLRELQSQAAQIQATLDWMKGQAGEMIKARIASIRDSDLKTVEDGIAEWTEKVRNATEKDGSFRALEGAVKRLEERQDKLTADLTRLDSPLGSAGILKVIHAASPASSVPKGTVKHLAIGLLGGLLVGGLILFLLNRSDDRLTSSTEIIEHFSEPILGQIPNVSDSRDHTGLPLLQAEDERYSYAEAFRSLRSSLIFMPNQADLKTLLITSAIPNEGKSTVASNLAVTMAAGGARVILIDADLRRGDIATLFDIDGKEGLSNVLRGEVSWKSAVQTTKYSTLNIIPRGPVTNQSAELLLKPVVETMLEELKAEYDLVVVNTAPILATDDTPTVAPHFDGVLMVMRAQFTSARLTQNSLQALYQRQVNVLGLILNCVDTEMPDYYYYRYPKYYAA